MNQDLDALPLPEPDGYAGRDYYHRSSGMFTVPVTENARFTEQQIRAARREGYELAMRTRADLLAEAHAQIRYLIDELTTAVDDDGLTRYAPPAANSLVYSNMIGALIPLATRMAEALASQPAQEQPISKAQEGREPVAWRVRRSDGEHELFFHEPTAKQRAECFVPHSSAEPLFTSPPPKSDEARDAERYRMLRDFDSGKTELAICRWSEHGWVGEWVIEHEPDAAIDAALAAQQKGNK